MSGSCRETTNGQDEECEPPFKTAFVSRFAALICQIQRRILKAVHIPMPNHSVAQFYDESGQIFTESRCRPAPIGATWTYKTRGSPKEFENFIHSGSGCASLWEIATRTLLLHLDSVDSGLLTGIPAPILERIWEKIQKSELDSFKVWKAFACSSPNLGDRSFGSRTQIIANPDMSMLDYSQSLNSAPLDFVTSLTLGSTNFSRADLINVFKITNLGSLAIGVGPYDILDDRVFRSWRRAVIEAGAFARLRVFVQDGESNFTDEMQKFLKVLPSLRFFSVWPAGTKELCCVYDRDWLVKRYAAPEDLANTRAFEALDWNRMPQQLFRISRGEDAAASSLPFFSLCLGRPPTKNIYNSIREYIKTDIPDDIAPIPMGVTQLTNNNNNKKPCKRSASGDETPSLHGQASKNPKKIRPGKLKQADPSLFGQYV